MHPVGVLRRAIEPLQQANMRGDRVGVEELAELGLAEELAELGVVDRERLRAALGEGSVAVVDEVRDEREEERRRERGGGARVARGHADPPRFDPLKDERERREIEDVAEALAVRLEDDRERRVLRRDGEQIVRPLALGPQRRALAGGMAREEERARGGLAEARGEERRVTERLRDEALDVGGAGEERSGVGGLVARGDAKDDSVVGPDCLRFARVARGKTREHRRGPGGVHARAEGG